MELSLALVDRVCGATSLPLNAKENLNTISTLHLETYVNAWIFLVFIFKKHGVKFVLLHSDIYKRNILSSAFHPNNNDNVNIFRCYINMRNLKYMIHFIEKL